MIMRIVVEVFLSFRVRKHFICFNEYLHIASLPYQFWKYQIQNGHPRAILRPKLSNRNVNNFSLIQMDAICADFHVKYFLAIRSFGDEYYCSRDGNILVVTQYFSVASTTNLSSS